MEFPLAPSEENSPEKNNVINDLNRIYEVVSSAGKFKTNYDDVVNVIDAMNKRCNQYSLVGKNAIKCDIIDGIVNGINFDALNKELERKINAKSKPSVGMQWNPLTSYLLDMSIEPYQMDELESMRLYSGITGKKETKKFINSQKRALAYMSEFINSFDYFESGLQKRREKFISEFDKNIPFLVNEHYKVVYNSMTVGSNYTMPAEITFDGITVPFTPKLGDFLKGAIKSICERFIK